MQSALASISDDDRDETLSESLAARLAENLAKLAVPQLSSPEQMRLVDIVECAATAEKHRRSMDENAMRYLLFFRQYMLRKSQGPANRLGISWREIIWAFHSGSQDILVDLVSKQFHGRMLWQDARESGMFMWMTDLPALVGLLKRLMIPNVDLIYRGFSSRQLLVMSIRRRMRRTQLIAVFIILLSRKKVFFQASGEWQLGIESSLQPRDC